MKQMSRAGGKYTQLCISQASLLFLSFLSNLLREGERKVIHTQHLVRGREEKGGKRREEGGTVSSSRGIIILFSGVEVR